MADCGSSSVTDSARAYTDTIPYEPRALPFIQFDQTDESKQILQVSLVPRIQG